MVIAGLTGNLQQVLARAAAAGGVAGACRAAQQLLDSSRAQHDAQYRVLRELVESAALSRVAADYLLLVAVHDWLLRGGHLQPAPACLQLFDEDYYLAKHPDVAAQVASGAFRDGFEHFVRHGASEGRSPHPWRPKLWAPGTDPGEPAAPREDAGRRRAAAGAPAAAPAGGRATRPPAAASMPFGLNVIGFKWFRPFGTEEELAATLRRLKADIDYAVALGVADVMIWEGVRPERAGRNVLEQHCLPRLLALLGEALPYAHRRGLNILCEPHPFTVAIEDWFAIELYDRLAAPNFGFIYDCCHYAVGRPDDYARAIANLGHRIRHIHFADSDLRTSELHFPPGEGELDLGAVVDALAAIGYRGTISLDLYGWPMPERGAAVGIPYLRRVIDRLSLVIEN